MKTFAAFFALSLLLIPYLAAADAIATVSSPGTLMVRGVEVSPAAAHSLPVLSGDEIRTRASPAAILLNDRSTITVDPGSLLVLVLEEKRLRVCVSQGSIEYELAPGAQLMFCALGRTVVPTALGRGRLRIADDSTVEVKTISGEAKEGEQSSCACAPPRPGTPAAAKGVGTAVKVVIIVGAATSGGVAAAILSKGDGKQEPISPVRQ